MGAFTTNSGKIGAATFKQSLLPHTGYTRPEVVLGPAYGCDTSIIELDSYKVLVTSSDPLSLLPSLGLKASAWLSVVLLINDMATSGVAPQYAQFVLNLPGSLSLADFEEYWRYIHEFCRQAGVAITGGHTGQIPGQESTICGGGTMFLTAPRERVLSSRGARAGNLLIMTKGAALTASSILALSFPRTLEHRIGPDLLRQAQANFYRTSCLKEALLACDLLVPNRSLRAMHDVTEGGILGAVQEFARAAGCSYFLDADKVLIGPEVAAVGQAMDLNPLHCIGAGSMLMAVERGHENTLLQGLREEGIEAAVIGFLGEAEEQDLLVSGGVEQPPIVLDEDPYWNAYFNALNTGWK